MPHLLLFATTTGYQTRMFAHAAREMPVACTLATDRCDHLDDPWGDQAIPVRFEKPFESLQTLLASHQATPFTGVAALGDRTTFLAALFAQHAGLPFHPPHAVEAANNKFLAKTRFREAGLLQPYFERFPASESPLCPAFPCVVKPLSLSGSRGVIRADNRQELEAALATIRRLLAEPDLLGHANEAEPFVQVEEFLPGKEFAIEGVVTHGVVRILAVFDKPDPLDGPYFEETIYVTPSREPERVQTEIRDAVIQGIRALGLRHGPFHAEVRHNERGAWVLEIAARPVGGYCARVLRFDDGSGLESFLVRHAVGEDVSAVQLTPGACGVMMIPIPKAGIYRGVTGVDASSRVEYVEDVRIAAVNGQRLRTLPEASSYLGFLFARAGDAAHVEQALRRAHDCLQFDIATELQTA